MTSHILERAQDFIWRNARLLERRLFAHLFLGGDRESVLAALRAYQNADGGFGNALEPDKRTPTSQPIDQEFALRVMDDVGFDSDLVQRMCAYLLSITTSEGGVPFVLPTVRDASRAEWWNTVDDPPASVNPTASIVGLLHKHGVQHAWLERATPFCWQVIESMQEGIPNDYLAALIFLEHAPDRPRAGHAFERLSQQLFEKNLVALDPHARGYVFKPLEWAPAPGSLCRPLFDDSLIAAHLAALVGEQQEDGGWPITWPAISPLSGLEYRGVVTLNALKTLKAYGYLQ